MMEMVQRGVLSLVTIHERLTVLYDLGTQNPMMNVEECRHLKKADVSKQDRKVGNKEQVKSGMLEKAMID